jgi:hypothetical protein
VPAARVVRGAAGCRRAGRPAVPVRGRSAAPWPSAAARFAVTAWAGYGGRVWPVVPAATTVTSHESPARTCCATLPSIYDGNVAIPLPSARSCDVAVVPLAPSAVLVGRRRGRSAAPWQWAAVWVAVTGMGWVRGKGRGRWCRRVRQRRTHRPLARPVRRCRRYTRVTSQSRCGGPVRATLPSYPGAVGSRWRGAGVVGRRRRRRRLAFRRLNGRGWVRGKGVAGRLGANAVTAPRRGPTPPRRLATAPPERPPVRAAGTRNPPYRRQTRATSPTDAGWATRRASRPPRPRPTSPRRYGAPRHLRRADRPDRPATPASRPPQDTHGAADASIPERPPPTARYRRRPCRRP